MPRSTFRILRTAVAACAACMVLHGCLGGDPEEDRYTEPAGEIFERLQFEFDESGNPHILAPISMLYRRTGPLEPWENEAPVRVRNYRTVHYVRTGDRITAYPLRNIQPNFLLFPVILQDTLGRLHALVLDGPKLNQYSLGIGGPSLFAMANRALDGLNSSYLSGPSQDGRPAGFTLGSETTMIAFKYVRPGFSVQDGERMPRLDSSVNIEPLLLRATPGFRALVARQDMAVVDSTNRSMNVPHVVYFRWRAGDTVVNRIVLTRGTNRQGLLSRYRDGYLLFLGTPAGMRAFSLDPDGAPTEREPPALPAWLNGYSEYMAADSEGCLHGLTTMRPSDTLRRDPSQPGLGPLERGFTLRSWNSCRPGHLDSLHYPPPADTTLWINFRNGSLRIDGKGTPWFAFIAHEIRQKPSTGSAEVSKSWIGLAAYREDGWDVDTVAVK